MTTLKVYPNPWTARDADGLPCAAVPFDLAGHLDVNEFVGAVRKADILRAEQSRTVKGRVSGKELEVITVTGRQRTRLEFLGVPSAELVDSAAKLLAKPPAEIPFTPYYRKRLLRGELFCADADTARNAALAFVPPEVLAELSLKGQRNFDFKAIADGLVAKLVKPTAPTPTPEPPARSKSASKAGNSED